MDIYTIFADVQVNGYNERTILMANKKSVESDFLSKDLESRMGVMKSLVQSAIIGTIASNIAADSKSLKIFTLPEFFFQPSVGAYPLSIDPIAKISDTIMSVINEFYQGTNVDGIDYKCDIKNWVFILGTVNYFEVPKDYSGDYMKYLADIKDNYIKLKSTGNTSNYKDSMLNVSNLSICFYDEGNGFQQDKRRFRFCLKRYTSSIDYGTDDKTINPIDMIKTGNKEITFVQRTLFYGINEMPIAQSRVASINGSLFELPIEGYLNEKDNESYFVLGVIETANKGFNIGVVICLDYISDVKDNLIETGSFVNRPTLFSKLNKPIKMLALISAGMDIDGLSAKEKFGNYPDSKLFINNDGIRDSDRSAIIERKSMGNVYYYEDIAPTFNKLAIKNLSLKSGLYKSVNELNMKGITYNN